LLMLPNKPVSFGKVKSPEVKPAPELPKVAEKPSPVTTSTVSEQKKTDAVPKSLMLPLPEIPVPKLPVILKKNTVEQQEAQKETESGPGEIIHKNIDQEKIVDDVDSTVSKIREQENHQDSVITLLYLGPPIMVKLNFSDRSGLSAENPVAGMVVTGVVGMLALLLTGVLLTVVVVGRKSMLGLFQLLWCGCSFILLLLSVASWLAFAGFGVALFDIRVKEAAEERYRVQHQIPADQEPGEESDVIIVPNTKVKN